MSSSFFLPVRVRVYTSCYAKFVLCNNCCVFLCVLRISLVLLYYVRCQFRTVFNTFETHASLVRDVTDTTGHKMAALTMPLPNADLK